jgi:hypothetical protein
MKTQHTPLLRNANTFGYHAPTPKSLHIGQPLQNTVVGFCSLLEFAAKSRNRTVRGFFHGTSLGGAVGRASALPVFAPRVPRSANPAALPPDFAVGRQSFNGTLEINMSNALTPVQFHGATLYVTTIDSVPYVAMRPVCEAIGLDWKAQQDRMKRHPVLNSAAVITTSTGTDGKRYDMLMLPLNKLNGWLFGVSVRRVKPELRERLTQYQAECFDVLAGHFGGNQKPIAHLTPAVQLAEPSIKNRRWLVSFDHTGREVVQAVPVDALVVTAAELPKLILHSDTFTGREVYDIASHANLRMMEETTRIGTVSDLEQLRKTVRGLPSHELTTLTRDAWMELGLRTVNKGVCNG